MVWFLRFSILLAMRSWRSPMKRVSVQLNKKEMAFLNWSPLKYYDSDIYKDLCFAARVSRCLDPLYRVSFFGFSFSFILKYTLGAGGFFLLSAAKLSAADNRKKNLWHPGYLK